MDIGGRGINDSVNEGINDPDGTVFLKVTQW